MNYITRERFGSGEGASGLCSIAEAFRSGIMLMLEVYFRVNNKVQPYHDSRRLLHLYIMPVDPIAPQKGIVGCSKIQMRTACT